MAENNLEAKITLDVSDLKKGLEDAKKAQTDYEKSLSDTQQAINENNQISKQYKKAIDDLNAAYGKNHISTEKYNKALARLTRDSKETEIATADLTKKLQDLQSGANGVESKVANSSKTMASTATTATQLGKSIGQVSTASSGAGMSVTTLITRFTSLQNSTGSTSSAVKALVGSLAGPAGIAFAISALIPILTKYGSELLNVSDYMTKTAKAQKQLALEAASEQANAQSRLATLDSLLKVARDITLSDEERTRAMAKINEEYGDLLPNLTLENINKEEVVKATEKLSKSLIREAQIRGAQNLIAKETEKMLLAQAKSAIENADAIDYTIALLTSGGKGYQAFSSIVEKGAKNQAKEIDSANKNIVEYKKLLDSLIGEDIAEGGTFSSTKPEKPTKAKSPKVSQAEKDAETIRKINAQLFKDELADAKEAARVQGGEVAQVLFQETGKLPSPKIFIDVDSEDAFRKIVNIESKLADIKKNFGEGAYQIALNLPTDELDAFQENLQISKGIAQGAALGITSAFDAMSQSVIKNSSETDSALTRFASSLGSSVLKIMATYLSQAVAGAIAGGTSSGAATGPGAIVAIPTMIATLTAAVIGAFAAIPKFAGGGIVPGGSFNGDKIPAMLNSGEMVLNNGQQANLFKALDGSLSSLQNRANNDTLVASTVLRGEDIYLSVTRQERIQKRFN